jgi:hypothetical protein
VDIVLTGDGRAEPSSATTRPSSRNAVDVSLGNLE